MTPSLKTKRLVLRPLSAGDNESISVLRSDENVNRYIVRPKSTSPVEATAFILKIITNSDQRNVCYWAICSADRLIGTICLWNFSEDMTTAEVGYELLPTYSGKGFAQEALTAILDYGFNTVKLKEIEAFTHRENSRSIRLLERNGFKPEPYRINKENPDFIIYTLAKH